MLQLASNAKINLGLLIKGRRPNGYHEVETLLYPVKLADNMFFERASGKEASILMDGIQVPMAPEENLVFRAVKALEKEVGPLHGFRIRVEKQIPAGAGLGGGSSNAATALKGLNQLFELGLSIDELAQISRPLGADVPFFLYNRPMLATGIGQDMEPYDIEIPYDIGLVTPGIHSSTAEAYKGLFLEELDSTRSLKAMLAHPIEEWKDALVNDLEVPVFADFPLLSRLKNDLYVQGAAYVSMTGTGSGIFAFFEKL